MGNNTTEVMDAEDPLFMLYTSGTTGKPKGILHTHGGYQVGVSTTLEYCFDVKPEDRYWCAADPGWITGHSYIVYGPLMLGATSIIYEGAPTHPYPDRWWKIVENYGVNILYTAPTAIRGLMRFGDSWPNRRDLSSLRLLGSVGETDQPRGVDVVPRARRPRPHADRGYVVADRDGNGSDHASPGGDHDEAGLGHEAVSRRRGRRRERSR
jgi:acetyl-CoA synthetase